MSEGLRTLNHYDGHKTVCTLEDKAIAARLGGHSWNIVNNSDKHEIYLPHARSSEHYIDDKGNMTSSWFERKRRVPHPIGGMEGSNWSGDVKEVMRCPRSPSVHNARQTRQLCQASAPGDFPLYSARRSQAMPSTPRKPGDLERTLPAHNRGQLRDLATPRITQVASRQDWNPRRGELRPEPRPPREEELFSTVEQLRAESHFNVRDRTFAELLPPRGAATPRSTPRGALGPAGVPRESAVHAAASVSGRTIYGTPRHPEDRVQHSKSRIENYAHREISDWTLAQNKLTRKDPYSMKPMAQSNNSGVKYDIITNERTNFWY